MKAELIILDGVGWRSRDTASDRVLAQEADRIGIELAYVTVTLMREREVKDCLSHALGRAHLVVVGGPSGSSGPEDIVKKTLSRILDRRLILNEELLDRSRSGCKSAGGLSDKSALLPGGATPITDPDGCPAGFYVEESGRFVVYLRDISSPAMRMIPDDVADRLKPRVRVRHRDAAATIRTYGISLSTVLDTVSRTDMEDAEAAAYNSPDGVDVVVTARAATLEEAGDAAQAAADALTGVMGDHVYATGTEGMESAVARLLTEKGLTISTAESCTGGFIAKRLTDVPGSTAYMERGMVTYSNRSKAEVLGVPNDTIKTYGAVSEETAKAMAEGVRWYSGTDIGLAVTGIAGPTGGTDEKPVGLVYIALAHPDGVVVKKCNFRGDRAEVRYATTQKALDMVRRHVIG
jgi:nicotinamide-nucleotide amidase